MDHLESVAALLHKQLAEIDAKIEELKPKPKPVILKPSLEERVSKLSNKKNWKKFISESGVTHNIEMILDESYTPYVDYIRDDFPGKKPSEVIGEFGSDEWDEFKFKTIQKLLDPNDFDEEYDFEDTAGGCDEVAWDAGCEVIQAILK
jgi:hypothetical protein